MAGLNFKPDSSFFRKIATGAVGTRAICADLKKLGHTFVELERGSTDTKLWKEVKRKRVRIPDLICTKCARRIESRAKTDFVLAMSHNADDAARAWDYGLVDTDIIAFPVCRVADEKYWSAGDLGKQASYWHERNWIDWTVEPWINYFTVESFRSVPATASSTKGVTEGSETSLAWTATFITFSGIVEKADSDSITVKRDSGKGGYKWRLKDGLDNLTQNGDIVIRGQIIASDVHPIQRDDLKCPGPATNREILKYLSSKQMTLRFGAVKLARLNNNPAFEQTISSLLQDRDEDIYIRLEAASYLVAVCQASAEDLFRPFLSSNDKQDQLEAVISLGEAATKSAVEILETILIDPDREYFLRSAAAWCLGRIRTENSASILMKAFASINPVIREEALTALATIGGVAVPVLITGLGESESDVAAGCAEAIRRIGSLSEQSKATLAKGLRAPEPPTWLVWLVGQLPRETIADTITNLQDSAPELHYAISLLWSFMESWISEKWERNTSPNFPRDEPPPAEVLALNMFGRQETE